MWGRDLEETVSKTIGRTRLLDISQASTDEIHTFNCSTPSRQMKSDILDSQRSLVEGTPQLGVEGGRSERWGRVCEAVNDLIQTVDELTFMTSLYDVEQVIGFTRYIVRTSDGGIFGLKSPDKVRYRR